MFIFGLGYTGDCFARQLLAQGWKVYGTVRSQASFKRYTKLGVVCVMLPEDVSQQTPEEAQAAQEALNSATHLLVTAAPTDTGDPMLARFQEVLKAATKLQWVGYLSTVGVYGDVDGQPVDENTPINPKTQRAKRRVLAEEQWLNMGLPVHIIRLPGIYGPLRGPLEKVRSGTARRVLKEGHVFSRIHVEDIVLVLFASMAGPRPGAVYNVADDLPAAGHVVTAYACELLGVQPPPLVSFEDSDLTPMGKSFYSESRFMTNDLLKTELGVQLRYPTYREGLKAQLEEERRLGVVAPAPRPWGRALKSLQSLVCLTPFPKKAGKSGPGPTVLLADNGSVRAASALNLRVIASQLEAVLTKDAARPVRAVHATSVRWSDRINADQLGGRKAPLTVPMLTQLIDQGERQFVILPFFFGPSASIPEILVKAVKAQQERYPDLDVRMGPSLVCRCPFLFEGPKHYGDDVIAEILRDRTLETIAERGLTAPVVVLVDHGSPQAAVGRVRNYVAEKMPALLGDAASHFVEASMERRDGPEYAFNDPLLETVLERPDIAGRDVVVSLMFLQPGKHAGAAGDIAGIIENSTAGKTGRVFMTNVIGNHPKLVALLAKRYAQSVPVAAVPTF